MNSPSTSEGVDMLVEMLKPRKHFYAADVLNAPVALIDCVLGPNLFYNSPMEACVVLCCTDKSHDRGTRRGKILFTNAGNEVTRVVHIKEIRAKDRNLSIPLYVGGETQSQTDAATESATTALPDALTSWLESSRKVRDSLQTLLTASAK